MKTVRLDSLRTQARQRANMESSQFVTDAEVNGYINNSLGAFRDLLLAADDSSFRATSSISVVAGTAAYTLPSDFYKLLGIDYQVTVGPPAQYVDVRRLPFEERNRYSLTAAMNRPWIAPFRYYLDGPSTAPTIVFAPVPGASGTVQLHYAPTFTTLTADADTIDGVDGLEEFVILDAAIKCLIKEETDVSVLLAIRADLVARIQANAKDRDANEPAKMSDVGMQTGWDGGYGWGGGGGDVW